MIGVHDISTGKRYSCRSVTAAAKLIKDNRDAMRKRVGIAGLHDITCDLEEWEAINMKLIAIDGIGETGLRSVWKLVDVEKIESELRRKENMAKRIKKIEKKQEFIPAKFLNETDFHGVKCWVELEFGVTLNDDDVVVPCAFLIYKFSIPENCDLTLDNIRGLYPANINMIVRAALRAGFDEASVRCFIVKSIKETAQATEVDAVRIHTGRIADAEAKYQEIMGRLKEFYGTDDEEKISSLRRG